MDFNTFCRNLQVAPERMEKLLPLWSEDPALSVIPEFLTPDFFARYREKLSLSAEELVIVDRLVQKVCETAQQTPELAIFCNLVFKLLFDEGSTVNGVDFPEFEALLGDASGIPALLICLGTMPLVAQKYASLGIPEEYHEGPLGWIGGTIRAYQAGSDGRYGQFFSQTFWLRNSMRGELFRIGRFEFQIRPNFAWQLPFFRNEQNEYLLFADPAWLVDEAGFRAAEAGDGIWQPTFSDIGGRLEGYPVDPATGIVKKEKLCVDAALWKPVLSAHSFCIHLHIPGGGGMTPELADSSFRQAIGFFRTYFHREVEAIFCTSWILNPDWQRVLPESNLTKLQKKLYLYPGGVDPLCGLFFVFGRTDTDFASYPADTSLRRAFHQIWADGGTLRPGSMVLPAAIYKD